VTLATSAVNAVDGSSTGTRVPWIRDVIGAPAISRLLTIASVCLLRFMRLQIAIRVIGGELSELSTCRPWCADLGRLADARLVDEP
jgi:hypothetical protein